MIFGKKHTCAMCGQATTAHNRDVRFRLPDPVLESPEQHRAEDSWLSDPDPNKATLNALSNDILVMVFNLLPVPSRISLGLTNKFFASLSQLVDTIISNDAATHVHDRQYPYFNITRQLVTQTITLHQKFFSSRRILLLELSKWMPREYRLCWACCKYTPRGSSVWYYKRVSSRLLRTDGPGSNPSHRTRGLYCHQTCHEYAYGFRRWLKITPEASCGDATFCEFSSARFHQSCRGLLTVPA